ncbi:MAG: NIL domain-containing protein [Dethiobacteria bacterium]|nr:4Fe-4S binding protein [Bacillota bacterium]MDW7728988.1 NIL domain-containing protein [Bacillota bacterium]
MVKQKVVLRFPPNIVEQPTIYMLIKDFDLMVNILRADINPRKEGRLMMEISGEEANYQKAMTWLKKQGLSVMNLEQQIIWRSDRCTHCGACTVICPTAALNFERPDMVVRFEEDKCIVCELCLRACPARAMETLVDNSNFR